MSSEKKVLVTGVSGFIGAHVLEELLKNGYYVRGTVRSQKKADFITKKYSQYKDNLSILVVEDISVPHAFDTLVKGVSGIIHVASPVTFRANDIKKDLVDPAIQLTQSVLEAAAQSTTVKRVVIMSSIVAIFDYKSKDPKRVFTESDWSTLTYEEAEAGGGHLGYVLSKKLSEKAAWDFMEEKKPKFGISKVTK